MGDKSADAPSGVTSGELAAVLQAMDEKYKPLFDALLSKEGGNSRTEIETKEEIHPLQMPLMKLEGSETYASWAEHAETILVSRKLEGYILGTIQKPLEESSKEGQKWKTTNALVRAWLLSSMSPQIAKQVERIKDACEIWRLLKGTYSGVGNEMLACRIQRELQELSQGEKTVVDYVSELKRRWSDLDYYDAIELECGKCIEKYNKWTERRRVRDFLNGLDRKFENRRAALYGSGTLPNLEQAISAIISEETRLKLEAVGTATNGISHRRSALFVTEGTNYQQPRMNTFERKCFECGEPGHLKAACPELVGGGRGRGHDWRGRGRGRTFDGRGGGRGRGTRPVGRANVSSTIGEASHVVNVEMTADDWEKWSQFKRMSLIDKQSVEAPATSASAASTNFGALDNETGGDKGEEDSDATSQKTIVGVIPIDDVHDDVVELDARQEVVQGEQQEESNDIVQWPKPNEEREVQVYARRRRIEEEQEHGDTHGSDPDTSDSYDGTPIYQHDDLNVPIAHRKQPRSTARKLPSKLDPYYVNHVSYTTVGPRYKSFIAALDSAAPIPHDWQEAKADPRWRGAMLEEMDALDRNNTWILTTLPANKKAVGCKWVFTIKQTPEGKVERYKARLVAKGYSQTYGVDYDETFAPVAKMNTIRTLISIAANCNWKLFQMDVKNAFLHGDLQEEVYMEIPPGFNSKETEGKVCDDDEGILCLKKTLAKSFEVKDLGYLHYFLGIEVSYGTQVRREEKLLELSGASEQEQNRNFPFLP
ncbi:hypothetical protein QYE76_027889 [Lolium multiflorum]|uniref:CCHC-type domain-containing protein n=1 Tax=Lolium multiflorum TaxID=4521 RepID=A0AAD8QJX9_LOLMU|nr:hypothetical protein QYE76_027889 [Lolium multiflorum]